jgi:hypothetical protein
MTKSDDTKKKIAGDPDVDQDVGRKRLLARMAGNIACGVVSNPSEAAASVDAVASISVEIAEGILQKIGL